MFGVSAWLIWKRRNNMVFNNILESEDRLTLETRKRTHEIIHIQNNCNLASNRPLFSFIVSGGSLPNISLH